MNTKTCKKCGVTYPHSHFRTKYYRKNGKAYVTGVCKICTNNRNKELTTPEQRERRRILEAERRKQWDYTMFANAKQRAKRKNLDFDIDRKYIREIMTDTCPVLGVKLERGVGYPQDNSPSLDRVDCTKGYVKGNLRIISDRANRIKRDASLHELKCIVEYMENNK